MIAADSSMLALLFNVALVAGALDAIAGGGALLTIPALLLAGLDPVAAIATSKAQSSFGNASACSYFARRGFYGWRRGLAIALVAATFGALGALLITFVPRRVLVAAVPLVLIGVALYFAFGHRPSEGERRARLSFSRFVALAIPPLALYDGVFGPGTGMFMMIAFVTLNGRHIVDANAQTKLSNTSSNLGAFLSFLASGHIEWRIAAVMIVGAVAGGQIGSHLALRHGARLIRPVVVVLCCVLAAKLLADPANPLRAAMTGWLRGV